MINSSTMHTPLFSKCVRDEREFCIEMPGKNVDQTKAHGSQMRISSKFLPRVGDFGCSF